MSDKPVIISPNTVIANVLNHPLDLFRLRFALSIPEHVTFVVGTQINGPPHFGTNLTQATAFLLAAETRRRYSVDTSVVFGALDNAPYEIKLDPESYHSYQLCYYHHLSSDGIASIINKWYLQFFDILSDITDVHYEIQTYSQQQASPEFRLMFFRSLKFLEQIRWCISPSSGIPHIRIPCPKCHWSEKRAERTKLISFGDEFADFEAFCYNHSTYYSKITPYSDHYLDLSTIYRNIVKESTFSNDDKKLYVIVKGGDWLYSCPLIDEALGLLGYYPPKTPMRIFSPLIVTDTGAKLSKSFITSA